MATEREFMMRTYYEKVFPFELIAEWLAYGTDKTSTKTEKEVEEGEGDGATPTGDTPFKHREFACVLEINGEETFLRYRSFQNGAEMRREFAKLAPTRIEIGPIYRLPVTRSNQSYNAAMERELIFDIDMDAYNEVRRCCTGNAVCRKCWPLATAAAKIINHTLRECFGFRHLLWVFSGRRGIHCWVADARARRLSNEARAAVIAFMALLRGGQGALPDRLQGVTAPLHPALEWALAHVVRPFFEQQYLPAQDLLADADARAQLLAFFADTRLRADLARDLAGLSDTRAMWQTLRNYSARTHRSDGKHGSALDPATAIALTYTYPRFDANVTTAINHLLKAPFCVHPASGKISVPIDIAHIDAFDIDAVPTLAAVADDIARTGTTTRLDPALAVLRAFVRAIADDPLEQHS